MTFTSQTTDNRRDSFRIARKNAVSINHGGTETEKRGSANGEVIIIHYEAPSLTTDTVFQLDILDEDDVSIYTKTNVAHNTKGRIIVDPDSERLYLYGLHKVKITTVTSQTDKLFNIGYTLG